MQPDVSSGIGIATKPDLGIEISDSQVKEVDAFYAKKRIVIPNGLDVPAKKCEEKKS